MGWNRQGRLSDRIWTGAAQKLPVITVHYILPGVLSRDVVRFRKRGWARVLVQVEWTYQDKLRSREVPVLVNRDDRCPGEGTAGWWLWFDYPCSSLNEALSENKFPTMNSHMVLSLTHSMTSNYVPITWSCMQKIDYGFQAGRWWSPKALYHSESQAREDKSSQSE